MERNTYAIPAMGGDVARRVADAAVLQLHSATALEGVNLGKCWARELC